MSVGVLRTATSKAITTKRVGPAQCERYNPPIRMTKPGGDPRRKRENDLGVTRGQMRNNYETRRSKPMII